MTTLLEVIREQAKKKGRPVKVICDWDECLQPRKEFIFWKTYEEKKGVPFASYFKEYWEKNTIKYKSHGKDVEISGVDEKTKKEFEKIYQEFRRKPGLYDESPFLSFAEYIYLALKEGLFKELIIVSSYNKNASSFHSLKDKKIEKFHKSFGKFPNAKIELVGFTNDTSAPPGTKKRNRPYRWEWLKENHPDFDIFIDDNPNIVRNSIEAFPDQSDKIYVMPDYKVCREYTKIKKNDNVRYVTNGVSNLKNEDFVKAAKEYEARKAKEKAEKWLNDNYKLSKTINWPSRIIVGIIVVEIIVIIGIIIRKQKNLRKK